MAKERRERTEQNRGEESERGKEKKESERVRFTFASSVFLMKVLT